MRSVVRKAFRLAGRHEVGFSLIEILVAIGIMAAIAAITVPLVSRFAGSGGKQAKVTERETVQTAIDAYLAENALGQLSVAQTTKTFTPAQEGAGFLSTYLRGASTTYCYTWDISGEVSEAFDKANGTC